MRLSRRHLAMLLTLATMAIGAAVAPAAAAAGGATTSRDATVLTVTGKDGTVKTYTLAQLQARTTPEQGYYEGYAGSYNSYGTLYRLRPVKGVLLPALLAEVGYDQGTDVVVTAFDDYYKLLSPANVQGTGLKTYSDVAPYPETAVPSTVHMSAVIAYAYKPVGCTVDDADPWLDQEPPPDGDGPLRLWFAQDTLSVPGYVTDSEWAVKWVDRIRVTSTVVKQWSAKLIGPKLTTKLRRNEYESCFQCHKRTVRVGRTRYQGIPLYLVVAKVDDAKTRHTWGAFNARKARKGYRIRLASSRRAVTISSKLIAKRPRNIILAWKKNGKELSGRYSPLWLVGGTITKAKRIYGVKAVRLIGVPR